MIRKSKKVFGEEVIVAPEGFVDFHYQDVLQKNDARIIEVRFLSDCPMIHTICHHHTENS